MLAILVSPPATAIKKFTAFVAIVCKKNYLYKFPDLQYYYKWKNYVYFLCDINHYLS